MGNSVELLGSCLAQGFPGTFKKLTRVWQERRRIEEKGAVRDWEMENHTAVMLTILSLSLS